MIIDNEIQSLTPVTNNTITNPGLKKNELENLQMQQLVNAIDADFAKTLVTLYEELGHDRIDLDKFKNIIQKLYYFNQVQKFHYLDYLLHPEFSKGCKIPSSIPVPSSSFQMHNTITLQTNSLGNLAFMFNPFFLYDSLSLQNPFYEEVEQQGEKPNQYYTDYFTTLFVNNDENLTGSSSSNYFKPVNINQGIPNVYGSYRVVSASIVVKYIGRLDHCSGVAGGAIIYDDFLHLGGYVHSDNEPNPFLTSTPLLAKYGNFDLAMDSFYHKENYSLDGIREIYFPLDDSFDDYRTTFKSHPTFTTIETNPSSVLAHALLPNKDYLKSGFNFFFYVSGAPPNAGSFKLDIYINYECLPNAEFLNYMPVSESAKLLDPSTKHEAVKYAQNNSITSAKDYNSKKLNMSIFDRIKNAIGRFLPSIDTIRKIANMTPYGPLINNIIDLF